MIGRMANAILPLLRARSVLDQPERPEPVVTSAPCGEAGRGD